MKGAATLLIMIALGVSGCGPLTEPSVGARDYLLGWYKLPNRHYRTRKVIPGGGTLIPVFKNDGIYYSVCRGFEVPLKECPEGLEWAFTPSSMVGTKIGFDEASNAYYIIIEDAGAQGAQYEGDCSTSGEKQFMTRVDKPSGLPDVTARPPRTNDDFLGWYQPVWFPWIGFEIRKDGKRCLSVEWELSGAERPAVWKSHGKPRELMPIPGRLGFTGFDRKNRHNLTYNEILERFELTKQRDKRQPAIIRMPLVRVSPHPEFAAVPPPMRIGIPAWH